MSLKWGIASVGIISHDFVTALGTLADHEVVAVAVSDLNKAKEFATLHEIEKYYDSYTDLGNDPNVEVVYIGLLNPQHFPVAMQMLKHGKHVLCEKPLCINEREVKELVSFAKQQNLFLMEAVKSRFYPSYQYMRDQIVNGKLGVIREIHVTMGSPMTHIDRVTRKDLGGGITFDLGVYSIQLCQLIFQQYPKSIEATGTLNSDGVDMTMKATLTYSDNAFATIEVSAVETLNNQALIKGSEGEITLYGVASSLHLIDVDRQSKNWTLSEGKHKFNFRNSFGLTYEAEEVRKCIRSGLLQSSTMSHDDSLTIARIEEEIRRQIGVVYEDD